MHGRRRPAARPSRPDNDHDGIGPLDRLGDPLGIIERSLNDPDPARSLIKVRSPAGVRRHFHALGKGKRDDRPTRPACSAKDHDLYHVPYRDIPSACVRCPVSCVIDLFTEGIVILMAAKNLTLPDCCKTPYFVQGYGLSKDVLDSLHQYTEYIR